MLLNAMSRNEGITAFRTRADHGNVGWSSNIWRLVMSAPLQIGLVLFPKVTQLDFTGPLQVFSSIPGAKVHLIWKRIEPVTSDSVMMLTPTVTFADGPQLDWIRVPGGLGTDQIINDEESRAFVRN